MKDLKQKIKDRFPAISFKEIVLYKNPKEFTSLYIERINPNHVGILWGKRRKDLHKGTHYIKAGLVYFNTIALVTGLCLIGWFDYAVGWLYHGLINMGIYTILIGFTVSFMYYWIFDMIGDRLCMRNISVS